MIRRWMPLAILISFGAWMIGSTARAGAMSYSMKEASGAAEWVAVAELAAPDARAVGPDRRIRGAILAVLKGPADARAVVLTDDAWICAPMPAAPGLFLLFMKKARDGGWFVLRDAPARRTADGGLEVAWDADEDRYPFDGEAPVWIGVDDARARVVRLVRAILAQLDERRRDHLARSDLAAVGEVAALEDADLLDVLWPDHPQERAFSPENNEMYRALHERHGEVRVYPCRARVRLVDVFRGDARAGDVITVYTPRPDPAGSGWVPALAAGRENLLLLRRVGDGWVTTLATPAVPALTVDRAAGTAEWYLDTAALKPEEAVVDYRVTAPRPLGEVAAELRRASVVAPQ